MDTLHLLFNAVTVIFIAATMFAAGLGTTISALRDIFGDFPLLLLALLGNLVVLPLMGWGIGALLGLATAAFVAGTLLATGPAVRRTTMGSVAAVRNGDQMIGHDDLHSTRAGRLTRSRVPNTACRS